jgi:hypothetical protein
MSGEITAARDDAPRRHTFVLRLSDRPGGMELIAATFAHRGISITATLGNDGAHDPAGSASVILTFTATPARKEMLKGALSRLSRVLSLVEAEEGEGPAPPAAHLPEVAAGGGEGTAGLSRHGRPVPLARQVALVRLAPGAPPPRYPYCRCDTVRADADTGEITYTLLGPPSAVEAALTGLRAAGHLRGATYAVLAV